MKFTAEQAMKDIEQSLLDWTHGDYTDGQLIVAVKNAVKAWRGV